MLVRLVHHAAEWRAAEAACRELVSLGGSFVNSACRRWGTVALR
jgi:hypothetical protein